MSTAMKPDIWDGWAYSSEGEETLRQDVSELLKETGSAVEKETSTTTISDLRHSRRRHIRSNAEIVDWHCIQVKPDVAAVVDASPDGILFQSGRKYRVGTELLVRFPFPCASSPKQRGTVVRIDEQPDGNSRVAVRFG